MGSEMCIRDSYITEKEKKKVAHYIPQSEWQKYAERPRPRGGGVDRTNKKRKRKTRVLRHNCAARLPRPRPGTERGGRQDRKNAGTTPNPAQTFESVSCSAIERPDYLDSPGTERGGLLVIFTLPRELAFSSTWYCTDEGTPTIYCNLTGIRKGKTRKKAGRKAQKKTRKSYPRLEVRHKKQQEISTRP